jgi:antitoxin YefM
MSTEPLTVARQRLSEIVDEVATTGSEVTITLHGRPTAVILGHDEYESLIETLNILSDPATMDAIENAEAAMAAGDFVDFE